MLLTLHGEYQRHRPLWVGIRPDQREERTVDEAHGWILLGEDIAFPFFHRGSDRLLATCIARGVFSPERRARRNAAKANARRNRQLKRQDQAWRGEGRRSAPTNRQDLR